MNRFAPASHVAPLPKTHADCAACGTRIEIQHRRSQHECSELCHPHGVTHDYSHEHLKPLVRLFNSAGQEICVGCAAKQAIRDHHEVNGGLKVGDVITLWADTAIEVTGFNERGQVQLKVRE